MKINYKTKCESYFSGTYCSADKTGQEIIYGVPILFGLVGYYKFLFFNLGLGLSVSDIGTDFAFSIGAGINLR